LVAHATAGRMAVIPRLEGVVVLHIPDGFLDTRTWVGTAVISAATLGYGLRVTRRRLDDRQIPFMGVMAAFIFAAQMINFPIIGGTSGHLLGGVLAAILLGPWTASMVITAILAVQALFFGDGGITALGANVLNMAIIANFLGYYLYRMLVGAAGSGVRRWLATFVAAWASVVGGAAAAAVELALAGTVPLAVGLPAMLFWHAFIGLGEGVITAAVLAYLARVRPDLEAADLKV